MERYPKVTCPKCGVVRRKISLFRTPRKICSICLVISCLKKMATQRNWNKYKEMVVASVRENFLLRREDIPEPVYLIRGSLDRALKDYLSGVYEIEYKRRWHYALTGWELETYFPFLRNYKKEKIFSNQGNRLSLLLNFSAIKFDFLAIYRLEFLSPESRDAILIEQVVPPTPGLEEVPLE